MKDVISYFISTVIILSLCFSIFYSYRQRTQTDAIKKGILAAKMNISMGSMLVFMALLQIFLFEANSARTILGILFLLLGLFNLFSGFRNYIHFHSFKR
ncbi:MAG: hypothetical protein JWM44_3971 [Bacilli bacterium]|jgi:glucose uptake protein GlcU|nr:hypothetical protein [Bacilli bacterium]